MDIIHDQEPINSLVSPSSGLPPYFPVLAIDDASATTPKPSKRRKLSVFQQEQVKLDDDDGEVDENGLPINGSARKSRPAGTKRACNQCRQQKLKCNVVENPWKSCDRCVKHKLECVITADFKRVGKRSQQAELERTNDELREQVAELTRALAARDQNGGSTGILYDQQLRGRFDEANIANFAATPPPAHDDGSHDAALLLNLKQSDPNRATPLGRITPLGRTQHLDGVVVPDDVIEALWAEYFTKYNPYLEVLNPAVDIAEHVLNKSSFLFWTVIMVASRHYPLDQGLFARLVVPYTNLVNRTIITPPTREQHHAVKGLCLLCTWPIPVSSTTADMTLIYSGVMMKFAMHLGIHRPSSPSDFTNIPINLRSDQIDDRLKTWAICNLVAQNVATSQGQPPETVWNADLAPKVGNLPAALEPFANRLRIEQQVDRVTRQIYGDEVSHETVVMIREELQRLSLDMQMEKADVLYFSAMVLHAELRVFFESHESPGYALALQELYTSTRNFIETAAKYDLQYAPNYIMQMCIAAAVSLLKLLNSFFGFADYVDREAGVELFWNTINWIRTMSVRPNDLPQRLAEVFAQMWNGWDSLSNERLGGPLAESVITGQIDASLKLTRRSRMSMSHVQDCVWRWKEEMHGSREQLKDAVKNPTSPIATTHRSNSISNGRRPSSNVFDDVNLDPQGMGGFSTFGGMTQAPEIGFTTGYDFFDPMGWVLNNDASGMVGADTFVPGQGSMW